MKKRITVTLQNEILAAAQAMADEMEISVSQYIEVQILHGWEMTLHLNPPGKRDKRLSMKKLKKFLFPFR
jgi:hypothetical protein